MWYGSYPPFVQQKLNYDFPLSMTKVKRKNSIWNPHLLLAIGILFLSWTWAFFRVKNNHSYGLLLQRRKNIWKVTWHLSALFTTTRSTSWLSNSFISIWNKNHVKSLFRRMKTPLRTFASTKQLCPDHSIEMIFLTWNLTNSQFREIFRHFISHWKASMRTIGGIAFALSLSRFRSVTLSTLAGRVLCFPNTQSPVICLCECER